MRLPPEPRRLLAQPLPSPLHAQAPGDLGDLGVGPKLEMGPYPAHRTVGAKDAPPGRLFSLPWTGAGAAGVPSPGPDVTGCWLELEARVEALVQSPGQRQARPLRGGSQQASPRVCVGTEGRRTGCRPGASGLEAASTEDSGGRLGAEASVPGRGPVGVTGVGGPSPAATILGLRPRGPESRHSGDKSTSWRGHPPTGELVSEQGALPLGLHVRKA